MVRAALARVGRDLAATAGTAMVYSFGLGIAVVSLPLLALDAGYSKPAIGILTAVSAVSQMLIRTVLAAVMRRVPDTAVVTAAGVLLALSSATLAVSTAPAPFVVCELLQGVARGCFWTGTQTHIVRGSGSSVKRLAMVNFMSSIGMLTGPVAAGLLAIVSLRIAMVASVAAAAASVGPSLLLRRMPPFQRVGDRRAATVWLRPGVDTGCAAGVTAGAWRALVSSYVPVALDRAGQAVTTIGLLVAAANAANLAGSGAAAKLHNRPRVAFVCAMVAAGTAMAAVGYAAPVTAAAAALLVASGLGAGLLQTLGPAVAAESVSDDERGDAIAVTGTFRAAALFVTPLGVGGLLAVIPLEPALLVAGVVLAGPVLVARRSRSRDVDGSTPSVAGA